MNDENTLSSTSNELEMKKEKLQNELSYIEEELFELEKKHGKF